MWFIRRMFQSIALGLIAFYQAAISPLLPHSCRFAPTCSVYAADAIRSFGVFKGFLLSAGRVLRCNPWNAGGVDPVPSPRKGSWLCR